MSVPPNWLLVAKACTQELHRSRKERTGKTNEGSEEERVEGESDDVRPKIQSEVWIHACRNIHHNKDDR